MLWIHDISRILVARALREDVGDTVAVPEVPAMSEATLMLLEFSKLQRLPSAARH